MNVGSLVRREPETVSPNVSCAEAARRMRDERIGSLVVAEERRPLGVLTDRDLVVRVLASGLDPAKVKVGEVMSERPIFVAESCDIVAALQLMRDLAVRRVPVVDESREIIGVVSLDDVILAVASQVTAVADLIRKEM
jgi:CBS domain-containing protein